MRHYLFNIEITSGSNCTVVFDYSSSFSSSVLRADVLTFHDDNSTCLNLIYIQPCFRPKKDILVELAGIFNLEVDRIQLLEFNESGFIEGLNQDLVEKIKYDGLFNIIDNRDAIIEGDELFHFILPSGKHSPFFIRTANALKNDFEINFIALCLLDELDGSVFKHIVCDTSSIISIGYALSQLWSLFGRNDGVTIQSFESYNKVDKYEFRPRSLVLISATNSGSLEREVNKESQEQDIEIVTLISNYNNPKGKTLININSVFSELLNNKERKQCDGKENCIYCDKNSIPVIVSGEQFIPSKVMTQKCLIYKEHVPNQIIKTMNALSCSESIVCFKSEDLTSKKREIFIDFKSLLDSKTRQSKLFKKILSRICQNNVPASVSLIIYLNDESSKLVADYIFDSVKANGKEIMKPIPHNKIISIDKEKDKLHTILVVSSCITTGNKLNSVSRDLRKFKNSSIHYITLLSRVSTKYRKEVLKGNLEYRKDKNDHCNIFTYALDCHLGDFHDQLKTQYRQPPWCEEIRFWQRFDKSSLPEKFSKRVDLLQSNSGLINELFFHNPLNEEQLVLRENFALYDIEKNGNLSQADVYFVFAGCFHYLRNPKNESFKKLVKGNNFLIQHEHVRTLIDPECFDRFNDGVAQACILRLASPSELCYVTEDDSYEIKNKLKDLFKNPTNNEDNEAILEFLYAIASGKLKFLNDHIKEFCDHINNKFRENKEISFFLKYIRKSIS